MTIYCIYTMSDKEESVIKVSTAWIHTHASKGCAKSSTHIKNMPVSVFSNTVFTDKHVLVSIFSNTAFADNHGVFLNTPPHREYSSLHGIRLTESKEITEVSELFDIQSLCE